MTSDASVEELVLPGVLLVHGHRAVDDRGSSRKVLTGSALRAAGVTLRVDDVLVTTNPRRGTLRGLHVQVPPAEETKLVWVGAGSVYDVVLDVRAGSPTRGRWLSVDLRAEDDTALLVPPGCAHGYVTREDDTVVSYLLQGRYTPACARTVRWDDPGLAIPWPEDVTVVSEADAAAPCWDAT